MPLPPIVKPPELPPVLALSGPAVVTPDLVARRSVSQFDRDLDIIESPPPGGGGGGASLGPFDLTFTAGTLPGDIKPTMFPGSINSVIPSDYLSLPDIAETGEFYFVLSVTVTDGQIATASVDLVGSPPAGIPVTLGAPPTSFDYLLGVVIDGVWFRSTGVGSKAAAPFETFRVGVVNPPPGTLPYEIYYSWSVA